METLRRNRSPSWRSAAIDGVDAADAAGFLATIKRLVEDPSLVETPDADD